jgi:hypothetical protein
MTDTLSPLRSNELFGGVAAAAVSRANIQPPILYSSHLADSPKQQLSKRAAVISASPTMTAPFKLREIQFRQPQVASRDAAATALVSHDCKITFSFSRRTLELTGEQSMSQMRDMLIASPVE